MDIYGVARTTGKYDAENECSPMVPRNDSCHILVNISIPMIASPFSKSCTKQGHQHGSIASCNQSKLCIVSTLSRLQRSDLLCRSCFVLGISLRGVFFTRWNQLPEEWQVLVPILQNSCAFVATGFFLHTHRLKISFVHYDNRLI